MVAGTASHCIVDLGGAVHRAYHAAGRPEFGDRSGLDLALGWVLDVVGTEMRSCGAGYVAVAWDADGPTFRHRLVPQYKANRPPRPAGLGELFTRARSALEGAGVPVHAADGYEGDDFAASLALWAVAGGGRAHVLTIDGDLLQLVAPAVEVHVSAPWHDRLFSEPADVRRRAGVWPWQLPDYKGLAGDASDNLPGVRGVGPVTARRLLARWPTLEEALDDPAPGSPRLRTLLQRQRDQAIRCRDAARVVADLALPPEPFACWTTELAAALVHAGER